MLAQTGAPLSKHKSLQTRKAGDPPKTHRQSDHWNRKPGDQSGVWKVQVRVAGFNDHLSPFLHWNTVPYPGAASKLSLKNAGRTKKENKEEGRRIRERERKWERRRTGKEEEDRREEEKGKEEEG